MQPKRGSSKATRSKPKFCRWVFWCLLWPGCVFGTHPPARQARSSPRTCHKWPSESWPPVSLAPCVAFQPRCHQGPPLLGCGSWHQGPPLSGCGSWSQLQALGERAPHLQHGYPVQDLWLGRPVQAGGLLNLSRPCTGSSPCTSCTTSASTLTVNRRRTSAMELRGEHLLPGGPLVPAVHLLPPQGGPWEGGWWWKHRPPGTGAIHTGIGHLEPPTPGHASPSSSPGPGQFCCRSQDSVPA